MSFFKKIANYCRASNNAVDERNRSLPKRETQWRLEACSTCHYLRETDSTESVYHPQCYYCEKRGIYIHADAINEKKCDKYL